VAVVAKSATRRAELWLAEQGWAVERCEHYAFGRRHDLWGFADLMAYKWGRFRLITALIQVTTVSNVSSRRRKIEANEHANRLCASVEVVVLGFKANGGTPHVAQRYIGESWIEWNP